MDNRHVNMLKAAVPYTSPRFRKPMQILIQAQELASYIRDDDEADLSACGLESAGDVEGMMESMRGFCSKQEKDTVEMVLNLLRTQKFYRAYRQFMASGKNNSDNAMFEFLMSQLAPDQQASFEKMSSILGEGKE